MPHKRPNFQRIIETNDPPKIIDPNALNNKEDEVAKLQRSVHFELPTKPDHFDPQPKVTDGTQQENNIAVEEQPYYAPNSLFSNPKKDPEDARLQKEDDGYYSLRKNYEVIQMNYLC